MEPNGNWFQTSSNAPSPPRTSNGRASSEGEEDLVEIRDIPRLASVKCEISREPGLLRTPPISSREQSTSSAPPPASTSGNKRPVGQVVDLTLDSDEDDEPPRAAKLHKSSNGLPKLPSMENGFSGGTPRQKSTPFPAPTLTPKEYGQAPRI